MMWIFKRKYVEIDLYRVYCDENVFSLIENKICHVLEYKNMKINLKMKTFEILTGDNEFSRGNED